jgi:hypothetical protein
MPCKAFPTSRGQGVSEVARDPRTWSAWKRKFVAALVAAHRNKLFVAGTAGDIVLDCRVQ